MTRFLVIAAASLLIGGCSIIPSAPTPAASEAEATCAGYLIDHVLEIDDRGNYQPIPRQNCPGPQQPRPKHWQEDGCPPVIENSQGLSQDQVDDYTALQCHIHRIIEALTSDPTHPKHLLVFVHGGLVTPRDARARAAHDIPLMMAERMDPSFMSGEQIFPLFFVWPSGFFSAYTDAMVNYAQGEYDSPLRRAATPLYLGTDLAQTASRASLELVKSLRRFSDAYLGTSDEPTRWGCDLDAAHFGCDTLGPLIPDYSDLLSYAATAPLRVVTTPSLDTGTSAWKNMVARTRFAVTKYTNPAEYRRLVERDRHDEGTSVEGGVTKEDILTRGALYFFFKELSKAIAEQNPCGPSALRITVIGHSMGEMVLNELMENFPDLPYQNIVYMGAAGSIRDFKARTEPVLKHPACTDLKFYNLTLHPKAEERDLEVSGLSPIGSLLMWIDDIFETPVTPLDRTLGKWQNIVYAENQFDGAALQRSYFHRFGLEAPDPIMHGQFAGPLEAREAARMICPAYNYWDPDFWSQVCSVSGNHCRCRRLSRPVPPIAANAEGASRRKEAR